MSNGYDGQLPYRCDCGQKYTSDDALRQHQTQCQSRSFSCSFCEDNFSTSAALRQHFILCGNKTDECPKCRRLIRRSQFAYHYENDCASADNLETPPNERKGRVEQRQPANGNKPVARVDIPVDDDRENNPREGGGRLQSPVANARNVLRIIHCEYCRHQCAQVDYTAHKEKCMQNPANASNKPSPRAPLTSNRPAASGIVHVPCEICGQQIDLPNWSSHTQTCREREAKRIKNRARSISAEPVVESFPCEHCHKLYNAKQFHDHEANCPQRPRNVKPVDRPVRVPVQLPVRRRAESSGPPRKNVRPRDNPSGAEYDQIDVDQTHAANRLRMQHAASDEHLSSLARSPRGYQNGRERLNEERPSSNHGSQANRSTNILRGAGPNEDPHRPPLQHRNSEIIDTRSGKHGGKDKIHVRSPKKKRSTLRRFFGCATEGEYD